MCPLPFGCLELLHKLGGVQQEGLQLAAVRAMAPYLLIENPILGFLRTFSLLQLLFRGQHQPEH